MAEAVGSGLRMVQNHGKSRVRVSRVWRGKDGRDFFVEWSVNISLLSDCLPAYFGGDNSGIVATDTMKNTVSFVALCLISFYRIPILYLFLFLFLGSDDGIRLDCLIWIGKFVNLIILSKPQMVI